MQLYDGILSGVARLARDRRAAVAPTFGLLLLPLLGLMGMAIDVSSMLAEKTRMQNIADAGALDYLRYVKAYMDTNGNTNAVYNTILTTAQTNATNFMNGLVSKETALIKDGVASGSNISASSTYDVTTGIVTTTTKVKALYQTSFMGIFNVPSVEVDTESVATSSVAKFMQVIFVIDASESMGVGATATDVAALQSNAQITAGANSNGAPCAFACHTNSSIEPGYSDNRALARTLKITLKIDSVQSAVQDFVNQLYAVNQSAPNHYNVGVYTFSNVLHTVLSPTTDFTAINNAISIQTDAIDLDIGSGNTDGGCWNNCQGWTNITGALTSVNSLLQNVGDGSSPTSLLTYVVILTDGVEDTYNTSAWADHLIDTTWSSKCAAIKSSGATVATVQALYLTLNSDAYNDLVAPISSQLPGAFSSCASSSDLALTATDGPGIQTAVQELFTKFATSPRLTN